MLRKRAPVKAPAQVLPFTSSRNQLPPVDQIRGVQLQRSAVQSERKVFVDGRLFLYLPRVLADWDNAVQLRPDWREILRRYDIAEILLRPSRPLVVALREEGWRVRAEGANFVLLARP